MVERSMRWKNYLKHDEQIKAMIQKSFYYDLVALTQEKEAMGDLIDINYMLENSLRKAEIKEDYDLCQLILDIAKRYKIELDINEQLDR